MPVSLLLTFVSTLAFGLQFLIFVYLYPSHRVRFFNYLVWAWGFFVLSKGLKLADTILPAAVDLNGLMGAAYVGAQFFIVAAALAYRYDYAIRRRDAILGGLWALGAFWTGNLAQATPLAARGDRGRARWGPVRRPGSPSGCAPPPGSGIAARGCWPSRSGSGPSTGA